MPSATSSDPAYCPDQSDIIWLNFDPQAGREQSGRRPAYVVTPRAYNQRTGLSIICPMTSQIKGYPFEVKLTADCPADGVVLSDHIKSLSWAARQSEYWCRCPEIHDEILAKLDALFAN